MTCRLSQELELKQHALALLKERMAGSESAQLADTVATLEAELAGEEEAAKKAKEAKESMVTSAKVGEALCHLGLSACPILNQVSIDTHQGSP